jgi:hypothetical protein
MVLQEAALKNGTFVCVCVCVCVCCALLCGQRPCYGLITRPRSPAKCQNWFINSEVIFN